MRVKVVRTPGEIRDEIGHKVMVRKDWEGTVVRQLEEDELMDMGFHPKLNDTVYMVLFDDWSEPVPVPKPHLVEIPDEEEAEED